MPTRPRSDDLTVLQELLPVEGRRVLDVGCGTGGLVRRLAALGADAVGLEISGQQLAAAVEADPDGAGSYLVGRAEALPLADASVDAVVFMKSLHHVPGAVMGRALAEARRVVRRDGAVYVVEPLTDGSLFALVCEVEDETEVRGLAQAALAQAPAVGLGTDTTVEYETRPSFAGFTAFCEHLVGVDPARAAEVTARGDELERAFHRLADVDPSTGASSFRAPMRAELLRPT